MKNNYPVYFAFQARTAMKSLFGCFFTSWIKQAGGKQIHNLLVSLYSGIGTRRFLLVKQLLFTGFLAFLLPSGLRAQLPTEFQKVELVTALSNATTFKFSPDGRVFILDRYGELLIYKPTTQTQLSGGTLPVFHEFEDGLLGIAFDPQFVSNNYIYLHYSPLSESVNRVSRFTMNGDVLDLGSEVVLLDWATQRNGCCHSGGDMAFDSQGNLYIATGDNTDHSAYATLNETNPDKSSENTSSNTNDLRGKIMRITPQPNGTYTIPSGNLFPNGVGGLAEIYVMGARNPYRIFVDKENTDWLFWGEVGPDANSAGVQGPEGKDEINLTKAAGNYGWPYFSGENEAYQITYANPTYYNNPASPQNISTWNTGATTLPPAQGSWLDFFHRCYLAGPRYYYTSGLPDQQRLPVEFDEAFFYYDFNTSKIWVVKMDPQGNILSNQQLAPAVFPQAPNGFIDMKIGPDGHLYILEYGAGCCPDNVGTGRLVRVDYTGIVSNAPPVVSLSATPTNGALPLEVEFSSEGTYDPNGDAPLSYAWDFQTDGVVDSTDPNPSFIYTVAGDFNVQLRVDDGNGGIGVKNMTINAGNTLAAFTFNSPADGGLMSWGDEISIDILVEDVEDGSTGGGGIDCADVNLVPSLGHLTHSHDDATLDGCPQTFTLEPGEHDIYGEMDIFMVLGTNYTDQGGLTSFDQIRLHPKRKEAEYFDSQSNVSVIANTDPWEGGSQAIRVDDGGYIVFEGRNLVNITAVKYKVSATSTGGSIELRVGGPGGTLLTTTNVPVTGSANNWVTVESTFTDPGGKNDLYFVFKGSPGQQDIFDLNYVEFLGGGVSTDNSPPLVNAVTVIDNSTLHIEFSESLQQASAETLANYAIDNGISVLEAVLQPDGRTVALTTSPLALGIDYNITVSNVQNLSGGTVATDSFPFTISCTPTGGAFPADWTVHQLEETGLPYASVYTFPHHDLDGDGLKDIVTGGWWYKNPGTASGNWVRSTIGAPFNNVAFVHDFDGDGDMDLLGTQGTYPAGADMAWAENDGSGNFTVHTNIPSGATTYSEPFLAGIAPGHFQAGGPFQMAINWNGAEVNNSPVQLLTVPADPVNTAWTLENLSPDSLGEDIRAGDIDGDGDLDLFQSENWLRNNGDGTWTTFLTGISYVTTPDRIQLADFDRDGDLDAVVGQLGLGSDPDRYEFSWFEAPADPTQAWTRHMLATDITGSLSVYTADTDFDGDMDIIVGEWLGNHELIAFENDLCGGGTWIRHTLDGGGPLEHHDGAQVTDIDNDGDLDIVSNGWLGNNIPRIFENGSSSSVNQAPVVTNPGPQFYNEGGVVSLQIVSEDPNAGDVLTYSAQDLPASLQIDESTGLISGTLAVALGEYPVTVRATDQGGLFDEEDFVITVTDQALGIRINSGGPAYSFSGENWSVDQFFSGGNTFSNTTAIANTENDQLYQTERFSTSGTLSYQVPVENGTYNVNLHFAEVYFGLSGGGSGGGEGSRVFNISVENGQQVVNNYDIFVAAGGAATAVVEAFTDIEVTDGTLSITLTSVTENPKISGIEVFVTGNSELPTASAGPDQNITLPTNSIVLNGSGTDPDGGSITAYEWTQQSGPNTATLTNATTANLTAGNLVEGNYVFRLTVTDDEEETGFDEVTVTVSSPSAFALRINTGGGAATYNGNAYIADQYFDTGTTLDRPQTGLSEPYKTFRYSPSQVMSYDIPVENGEYTVNLHFAELWFGATGGGTGGSGLRVFDVSIEGSLVEDNLDIFAEVGAQTMLVKTYTVTVSDGELNIDFSSLAAVGGARHPVVNAIEVLGDGTVAEQPPVADAGPDQNITLPTNSIVLNGSGTDPDGGSITAYEWTQQSGPNTATLTNATTANLTAGNLVEGNYVFRLTVTDDEDETGFDEVAVTVSPEAGTQIPTADAGADQNITLPTNSIVLNGSGTDPDGGSITAYEWTQQSGPNTATLTNATTANLTAGNLVEGNYVFRLTVTDDEEETGFDEVTVTVSSPSAFALRINTGGGAATYNGNAYIADQYFDTGATLDRPQTGLSEPYKTFRYSPSQVMSYDIPVENGEYTVNLHFAELWFGATGGGTGGSGLRVFDISIEGSLVEDNLDIYDEVGAETMLVKTYTVTVLDGELNIDFSSLASAGGVRHPAINAIEVLGDGTVADEPPVANAGQDQIIILPDTDTVLLGSGTDPDGGSIAAYSWTQESGPSQATLANTNTAALTVQDLEAGTYVFRLTVTDDENDTAFDEVTVTVSDPQPTTLVQVNSGGPAYSFEGDNWSADQYFTGGGTFSRNVAIAGTANDQLYQTERYVTTGTLIYNIPVPAGTYDVALHFAEIYFGVVIAGGEGSRVFNISIENGQQVLNNYDIVVAADGSATAVIENFSGITVSDGNLTITLNAVIENPKISGIEVFSATDIASRNADSSIKETNEFSRELDSLPPASVSLFPNPTAWVSEVATSNMTSEIQQVLLFDVTGRLVRQYNASQLQTGTGTYQIEVSDLEEGTYFVKFITADAGNYYKQLVVKKR